MSAYTPSTNFAAKDALISGNPLKIVKGTEISAEFNSISTVFTSKVDQTAVTGSAAIPVGTTAQRDGVPVVGYTRVNSTTGFTEWWSGSAWLLSTNQSSAAGSVLLPSGTTAERDGTPAVGYTRHNSTLSSIESWFSGTWNKLLSALDIGVTVQAYNAANAVTNATQTFTVPQRGSITADNDLSFDLNASNYFSCTPTAGGVLTFTNIATGQSGHILLTNNSNYAITAAATTKINAADLAAISVTGIFILAYFSNGTNVYISVSRSFA